MKPPALHLDGLNPAQRQAVTAPGGFHLLIAGAGTGKTRTLVHRVAWLLAQGERPEGIVLLTFTRRAAREMLDRASQLVGPPARRVRGGTFHAYAVQVLRQHAPKVGRSAEFTVLDRADAEELLGMVREELGLGGKRRRFPNKATLLRVISRAANTGEALEQAVEVAAPRFVHDLEDIQRVAAEYAQRKAGRDLVDFDDLLVLLRLLLKANAQARAEVADRCRHVLVDEYQDTNRVQGHIAALLASAHGNLMVVGDEAQSIYAFRGATVRNILDFPKVLPGARTTVLEENYRSTQPVLDLANAVLRTAAEGYDKHLRSARQAGPRPRLLDVVDEAQEADAVVAWVLDQRERGVPLREQAVLFRAAFHAVALEAALTAANIPFRKFGGLRFAEAAHVKDVVALLRLVANPRDELSWLRVLGWLPGVGPKTAARILQEVLAAQPPRLDPGPWRGKAWGEDLAALAETLAWLAERPLAEQVQGAVDVVREDLERRYDDAWRRERDLEAFGLLLGQHEDLDGFLAALALDPPEAAEAVADEAGADEAGADEAVDEWLTLSTVHSAKGLEWTAVAVLQLADGRFPSGHALDAPEALEEERRLLYVAVTRSRRELLLCRPRFVQARAGWGFGPGCSLLDALPDRDRVLDAARWQPPAASAEADPAASAEDEAARLSAILAWMED